MFQRQIFRFCLLLLCWHGSATANRLFQDATPVTDASLSQNLPLDVVAPSSISPSDVAPSDLTPTSDVPVDTAPIDTAPISIDTASVSAPVVTSTSAPAVQDDLSAPVTPFDKLTDLANQQVQIQQQQLQLQQQQLQLQQQQMQMSQQAQQAALEKNQDPAAIAAADAQDQKDKLTAQMQTLDYMSDNLEYVQNNMTDVYGQEYASPADYVTDDSGTPVPTEQPVEPSDSPTAVPGTPQSPQQPAPTTRRRAPAAPTPKSGSPTQAPKRGQPPAPSKVAPARPTRAPAPTQPPLPPLIGRYIKLRSLTDAVGAFALEGPIAGRDAVAVVAERSTRKPQPPVEIKVVEGVCGRRDSVSFQLADNPNHYMQAVQVVRRGVTVVFRPLANLKIGACFEAVPPLIQKENAVTFRSAQFRNMYLELPPTPHARFVLQNQVNKGLATFIVESADPPAVEFRIKDTLFKIAQSSVSLPDAQAYCTSWNGMLSSVLDQAEHSTILQNALRSSHTSLWLGAERSCAEPSCPFRWSDGFQFGFTRWAQNQPSQEAGTDGVILSVQKQESASLWSAVNGFEARAVPVCRKPVPQDIPQESNGKFYYKVTPSPVSREQAEAWCKVWGGKLASIREEEENDLVAQMAAKLRRVQVWVGGSKESGSWKWSDLAGFDDYPNWQVGQPNSEEANKYVMMNVDSSRPEFGQWVNINKDNRRLNAVCKKPVPKPPIRYNDIGSLWGIRSGKVLYRNFVSLQQPAGEGWTQLGPKDQPGKANLIAVGPKTVVWVHTEEGMIFYRVGVAPESPFGTGWQRFLDDTTVSPLRSLSCNSLTCWAVSAKGVVWVRTGISADQPTGTAWLEISPEFAEISAGPNHVWAVGLDGVVYVRQGVQDDVPQGKDWQPISGPEVAPKRISVGVNGMVVLVGVDKSIYVRLGISNTNRAGTEWRRMEGRADYVAAGSFNFIFASRDDTPQVTVRTGICASHLIGTKWLNVNGAPVKQMALSLEPGSDDSLDLCSDIMGRRVQLRSEVEEADMQASDARAKLTDLVSIRDGSKEEMRRLVDQQIEPTEMQITSLQKELDNADIMVEEHKVQIANVTKLLKDVQLQLRRLEASQAGVLREIQEQVTNHKFELEAQHAKYSVQLEQGFHQLEINLDKDFQLKAQRYKREQEARELVDRRKLRADLDTLEDQVRRKQHTLEDAERNFRVSINTLYDQRDLLVKEREEDFFKRRSLVDRSKKELEARQSKHTRDMNHKRMVLHMQLKAWELKSLTCPKCPPCKVCAVYDPRHIFSRSQCPVCDCRRGPSELLIAQPSVH